MPERLPRFGQGVGTSTCYALNSAAPMVPGRDDYRLLTVEEVRSCWAWGHVAFWIEALATERVAPVARAGGGGGGPRPRGVSLARVESAAALACAVSVNPSPAPSAAGGGR